MKAAGRRWERYCKGSSETRPLVDLRPCCRIIVIASVRMGDVESK